MKLYFYRYVPGEGIISTERDYDKETRQSYMLSSNYIDEKFGTVPIIVSKSIIGKLNEDMLRIIYDAPNFDGAKEKFISFHEKKISELLVLINFEESLIEEIRNYKNPEE